ncbi:MAG: hypothetical protein COX19_16375 [Desulfobacterales bacterium CG23_combo_of_CG06-09_8_20_14_all_51_8]|nr:MAG: hypothetical protein COX19_16375 [Desulfobacterales bacterium CG23_combo_of_CG06-09_8_20_14_all_51_8]
MTDPVNTYEVICRTCRTRFKVQLFDSHDKNLFVADKKDWYCEQCKRQYFKKQTTDLAAAHQKIGFSELTGSEKTISWAEKIRAELINKVKYFQQSLKFASDAEKQLSDQAFEKFLADWQSQPQAKWWIDHRQMTVRDISSRISAITDTLKNP